MTRFGRAGLYGIVSGPTFHVLLAVDVPPSAISPLEFSVVHSPGIATFGLLMPISRTLGALVGSSDPAHAKSWVSPVPEIVRKVDASRMGEDRPVAVQPVPTLVPVNDTVPVNWPL